MSSLALSLKSYVTREPHYKATKYEQQETDNESAALQPTGNPSPTDIPVVKGPKGLCYDIGKVADEGRRKRLLANRASAKSSRQRRLNEARAIRNDLARLEDENSALRKANNDLRQQITEAHAVVERFYSFALNAIAPCAGEVGMPPCRTTFTPQICSKACIEQQLLTVPTLPPLSFSRGSP